MQRGHTNKCDALDPGETATHCLHHSRPDFVARPILGCDVP
jgi:hypothetical protein